MPDTPIHRSENTPGTVVRLLAMRKLLPESLFSYVEYACKLLFQQREMRARNEEGHQLTTGAGAALLRLQKLVQPRILACRLSKPCEEPSLDR
jgi:hypothetical protein